MLEKVNSHLSQAGIARSKRYHLIFVWMENSAGSTVGKPGLQKGAIFLVSFCLFSFPYESDLSLPFSIFGDLGAKMPALLIDDLSRSLARRLNEEQESEHELRGRRSL